jgi:hypothetical protein
MFCDYAFWKALAKAVEHEEPHELATEFLQLMFAVTHPDDLREFHDEDHHLQSAWDELVEPSAQEIPGKVLKAGAFPETKSVKVSELSAKRIHALLKNRFGDDIYASWFSSL